MKRRNFLSMLGAAMTAPLMPVKPLAAAPAAVAGYNRYQYGLAVFHARTRASLSIADLMGRLNVSSTTAEALMAEMKAKGVIAPMANAAAGAMRAVSAHKTDPRPVADRLASKAKDIVQKSLQQPQASDTQIADKIGIDDAPPEEQETNNGQV